MMKHFFLCFLIFSFTSVDGIDFADYTPPPPFEEAIPPPPPEMVFPDLEDLVQDFVLETKQILIDGYPNAFNPSIIRYQGRLLLCFRFYESITGATDKIGLVWLDDELNPASSAQIIDFRLNDPFCIMKRQDPRLVALGESLFIVYNNVLEFPKDREIRRMAFAELFFDGERFSAGNSDCFVRFEKERIDRSEKNWVPFEYNGELLLAYSLVPHRIFRPLFGKSECELVASTLGKMKWDWGVLRGGTPALLNDEGEFLSFFHCSKSMCTVHSKGRSIPHYFMGAYTFSAEPPFELTRMSPMPIIGKNFYHGPAHKTWKPLVVVFPGGYVFDGPNIWIVYGRQDHEVWAVKIDKEGLLKSLVPITLSK